MKKRRENAITKSINHAKERIQQRGIPGQVVDFIIDQADKVEHSRNGANAIFV